MSWIGLDLSRSAALSFEACESAQPVSAAGDPFNQLLRAEQPAHEFALEFEDFVSKSCRMRHLLKD